MNPKINPNEFDSNTITIDTTTDTTEYYWGEYIPYHPPTYFNIPCPHPKVQVEKINDKILFYYYSSDNLYYAVYEDGKDIEFKLAMTLSDVLKVIK